LHSVAALKCNGWRDRLQPALDTLRIINWRETETPSRWFVSPRLYKNHNFIVLKILKIIPFVFSLLQFANFVKLFVYKII
jgi:hypothetical protein